ncbi:MAG: glycosyltransferase family 4 protein, partial [Chloracidobacterium sp.]
GQAFGGGERHVLELIAALAARGHAVHIAAPAHSALAKRLGLVSFSHHIHALAVRHALDVGAAWRLVKLVRHHQIDILHAHYARDYPVAAGVVRWQRWTAERRPALFLTRHHYAPLTGNWFYHRWLGVAERLIAVSDYVRERAQNSLGWDTGRIVTIPNWVDTTRFHQPSARARQDCRRQLGLPVEGFIVGCLNRLEPSKGQATLLGAVAFTRRQTPHLHLALAGSGQAAYLDRLRQQASQAGVERQVTFLGFIEDAPGFLAACDVMAIPSHDEAFSLGVLEAWAAGVPVVVSDVGGLAELVTHENNGLRVAPRDPLAWAAALQRMAADEQLRRQLAAAGRQSVGSYTLDHAVTAVETLYQTALIQKN